MNNKKKQLMLTVIGLIGLIAITVGVSVAFFNYTKTGSTDNTLTTGSVMFTYTEVSGIGRGITLTDAIPMTDDLGKAQTGEGKVFEFKVSGKGANNASIPYEVTARMSSDSNLDQSKVRIYLEKDNSQVLLDDYSELDQTSRVSGYTERTLYEGKIPRNSGENYTENFKLKMWLSSEAISENNEYPYNNKTFKITVNIYAEGNVYTQQQIDLEESAKITSVTIGNGPALTASTNPSYDYDVTTTDRNITVNVTPENENAQVTIEKVNSFAYNEESNIKRLSNSNVTSQEIALTNRDNYIKITIQPEDRSIEPTVYKLHVYRTPNTTNTLDNLAISDCPLNEIFGSETTSYTCTTTEPDLEVTATKTDKYSSVSISGNTGLERGTNIITVVVTPEDTTAQTKTYTITVTANLPIPGSYSSEIAPVTLQGLAKMVYDDNNKVQQELSSNQLRNIDNSNHTNYLYKSTLTNSGKPTYYFRGEVTNNYVDFAGQTWRIVRINEDGTVRMIMVNGIDNNKSYAFQSEKNNKNYMYYTYKNAGNSVTAKTRLDSWINSNITGNNASKVASGKYYCEQAKVLYYNWSADTGTTWTNYSEYNPDFRCQSDDNGHGIVEAKIGLLTYDEVVYAGGYPNRGNVKYYLYAGERGWWTMSPGGIKPNSNAYAWKVNDPIGSEPGLHTGTNQNLNVLSTQIIRPVINLKADVTATKLANGHYQVN